MRKTARGEGPMNSFLLLTVYGQEEVCSFAFLRRRKENHSPGDKLSSRHTQYLHTYNVTVAVGGDGIQCNGMIFKQIEDSNFDARMEQLAYRSQSALLSLQNG